MTSKVPPPPSRFRQPLSILYIPPWLRHRRARRGKSDRHTGSLAVEVPVILITGALYFVGGLVWVGIYVGLALIIHEAA